jgi:fluoride ion exporter CrcB/FEX
VTAKTMETTKNGLAAAALVAGGIGSFAIGLMTVLAEASAAIKTAITFYAPTGALSGKTTVGVIIWLAAWAILGSLWGKKDVDLSKAFIAAFVLLALGLLFTFPPFFLLFGA